MKFEVKYKLNQLRDYSSLFSRNEVISWLRNDFTSINYKIARYDANWYNSSNATYLSYLKYIYSILESQYQFEYVLKNAFLNDSLISEIGEQDSKVYSEFRVGNAIADLVMFNGHSKIFEIKTEYDKDVRLPVQLENYRKAFNQIFLIIPESKLTIYEKYDKDIGLITFNAKNVNSFYIHREASINLEIDSTTIMNILHTDEFKSIVTMYYGNLPPMTSFNQFRICSELVGRIPKIELNKLFIAEIKKRVKKHEFSTRYFKEFNQISLSLKMNRNERNQMITLLKTPLKQPKSCTTHF